MHTAQFAMAMRLLPSTNSSMILERWDLLPHCTGTALSPDGR